MTSADPLETIKQRPTIADVLNSEILWMVAEIDRLRAELLAATMGERDAEG
jgi:hypothetical protein